MLRSRLPRLPTRQAVPSGTARLQAAEPSGPGCYVRTSVTVPTNATRRNLPTPACVGEEPLITTSPRSRRATGRAVGSVAIAVVGAGLLVNVYLAVVGRQLSEAQYSHFGAYWSISLIVAFGAFLPVEQELARLLQTSADPRAAMCAALKVTGVLAAIALAAVAIFLIPLSAGLGNDAGLISAIPALIAVSVVQFLVRGMLIGLNRITVHATIILVDAALRVAGSLALAALVPSPTVADFGWMLVVSISIAHIPMLPFVLRESRRRGLTGVVAVAPLRRAVLQLLVATSCAQLLLNGAPLLVAAVATPGEQQAAGRFLAAFTLARIPLFIAVPLQSAVLPTLTRLVQEGRAAAVRVLLAKTSVALAAVGTVGVLIALTTGADIVQLIFGERYVVSGRDLALMVAGAVVYLGLLLTTQAMVASGLHSRVAQTWLVSSAVGALVFVVVPDLFLRAELGFLGGSCAGWAMGTVLFRGLLSCDQPTG